MNTENKMTDKNETIVKKWKQILSHEERSFI